MLGMCLGEARRMRITFGAAWELLGPVCHELSLSSQLLHFSSYSSPLGRCFSSPRPVVAAFTGPLGAAGSRAAPQGAQVTLKLALPTATFSSPSRASPIAAVVAAVLALLTVWMAHHRGEVEDASTGRGRARVAHWFGSGSSSTRARARGEGWSPCMQLGFYFFVLFLNQNGVVLAQSIGAKTAPFQLKPSCLRCKTHRFTNGWVNFLKLHFCPITLLFFHRCPSTMLLKLHIFSKNI
ncbi:hypothetical protein ACOSQ3_004371 [Xanthoceras sorbifolium]